MPLSFINVCISQRLQAISLPFTDCVLNEAAMNGCTFLHWMQPLFKSLRRSTVERLSKNVLDVNSCWTVFGNNVIQLIKKYVPNKITCSRKCNAWMNTKTRRMVHLKNRAFTKSQFMKSLQRIQTFRIQASHIRMSTNYLAILQCIHNIVCLSARKKL